MADTLLLSGDCMERLRALPDASIHACVTDPPYDLTDGESARGFMGKAWDGTGIAFDPALWREVLRVLKPGGYVLAFGGTRTYHRMATAIEAAGFAIRDCISWQYGSGFPKSLDVSKAIDRAAGAEREVVGIGGKSGKARNAMAGDFAGEWDATAPATDDARRWSGWGTALKPAWEPIVLARRPLDGTVAANVATHGTGAVNIAGCRVGTGGDKATGGCKGSTPLHGGGITARTPVDQSVGRWPANLLLSCDVGCDDDAHAPGCPVAALDAQQDGASRFFNKLPIEADDFVPFFYGAKASRAEREAGCDALPARTGAEAVDRKAGTAALSSPRTGAGRTALLVRNHHPCVKPVSVMRWCVRLVVPPDGIVLDPFMGSGTTGIAAVKEGVAFVGIEREAEYLAIAKARIANAKVPE